MKAVIRAEHKSLHDMMAGNADDVRAALLIRADLARRDMDDWRNQSYSRAFHRHWTAIRGLHLEYDDMLPGELGDICNRNVRPHTGGTHIVGPQAVNDRYAVIYERETVLWAQVWLALMWSLTLRRPMERSRNRKAAGASAAFSDGNKVALKSRPRGHSGGHSVWRMIR